MDSVIARKMHRTLEAYHGMIYFSAVAAREYESLGAQGVTGYFASRAAPMGAVTPKVVTATFFNFNPELVEPAMAGAWDLAPPLAWIDARLRAVDETLRDHLSDGVESDEITRAAALARVAADGCWAAGRPLAAGLLGLEWPDEAHLALWHAIAILREFRGDGHIACLVERGIEPREALLLHSGTGVLDDSILQATRGWGDAAWAETRQDLQDRGLLDGDGRLTASGTALRDDIEIRTDEAALTPWAVLGEERCAELRALVRPFSRALLESRAFGG